MCCPQNILGESFEALLGLVAAVEGDSMEVNVDEDEEDEKDDEDDSPTTLGVKISAPLRRTAITFFVGVRNGSDFFTAYPKGSSKGPLSVLT